MSPALATLPSARLTALIPGLSLALVIAAAAIALRGVTGIAVLSPMLVSVLAGMAISVVRRPDAALRPGLAFAMRPVLRAGIVLLGLQLTLGQIADLGATAVAVAAVSLGGTYLAMRAVGRALGVPAPLAMLLAAGTSVCGASAVIAANAVARGTEEDVTFSIGCVTLFGTLSMLAMPPLAALMGMDPQAFGIWTGAAIHEVAQVTAAAFQFGDAAGQAGTVTKLVRVMLLAPLVVAMTLAARRAPAGTAGRVPFPWFVLGFVAMIGVNSVVTLPEAVRQAGALLSVLFLSAGLAAMGLMTDLGRLRARGGAALALAAFGAAFILGLSLLLIRVMGV